MTTETSPPGPANPPEERTCRKCDQTKTVSPETWHYRKVKSRYQAYGLVCLECKEKQRATYVKRRDAIAAAESSDLRTSVLAGGAGDRTKMAKAANKLDVALAMKAGGRVLNEVAPSVMARIQEYLDDPDSEHHIWALEFFAQRILPRKLYEELGGQAAGVGAIGDKRPQFQINILPAGSASPGRVFDGEGNEVDQQ